jgi:hypothetical protein
MVRVVLIVVCAAVCCPAPAATQTCRDDGALVEYSGISETYAKAIARTVSIARAVAAEKFGLDMPDAITVSVECDPSRKVRLFNDGQDRVILSLSNERNLLKPATSGYFHIYGLCHEVGHLAQYRPIRDHSWMTSEAAEGWAHYIGSRLVDEVHARAGDDLWPDAYDYLADGTQRLEQQWRRRNPPPLAVGARAWHELWRIVGDKGVAPIFKAWGEAEVDPADPAPGLRQALLAANDDERLGGWWDKAAAVFVVKRGKSKFVARTVSSRDLTGRPTTLSYDDGSAAGKASLAGGGHAVRFEAPAGDYYLTSVRIHGSRYGAAEAPDEGFHVWLCDADFNVIAGFEFPYDRFDRGEPEWVRLQVEPTSVPRTFIVCVGFNPTATRGVFLSHDKESSGHSLTGLPGQPGKPYAEGNWLIRVQLDKPKVGAH